MRRNQIYGSLRRQDGASNGDRVHLQSNNHYRSDSVQDDGFLTPKGEDERGLSEDDATTQSDGEEISSRRRREKMYIELPNGKRRMPSGEECNLSRSSSKAGGIYSSIDLAVSHKENASTSNNDKVKQEAVEAKISGVMRSEPVNKMTLTMWMPVIKSLNKIIGLIVMIVLANLWSNHLQQLHENDMWFSNIEEVKREISFRTEQGLYYSYFKHLVNAESLQKGINDLERDNLTEHTNTINIWKRFNIYQELILAAIHRVYSFNMEPILFYVEMVFSLQGFHAAMLFLISWSLSGTWVSGVLTLFYMVVHRNEITRVCFAVPLREHFSLPFFYAMLVSVARFFSLHHEKPDNPNVNIWSTKKFALVQIYVMTFIFVITWQFAQFALFLHSVVCFIFASAQLLHKDQVNQIFFAQFCAILTVWHCQYYQPMIITSLAVSFIPLAMMFLHNKRFEYCKSSKCPNSVWHWLNIFTLITRSAFVLVATLILNMSLKSLLGQTDDNHIFQFVASWIGYQDETDFDTRLYRCLAVFRPLGMEMYHSLMSNAALPLYFVYMGVQLGGLLLTLLRKWYIKDKEEDAKDKTFLHKLNENEDLQFLLRMDQRPVNVYHIGISAIFAILGMLMARMVVFWSPYIMVISSVAICDCNIWTLFINKLSPSRKNGTLISCLRHFTLFFAIITLYLYHKESILEKLEDLREFWDPDTVDLMEWINQNTPKTAAFAGTMQLLAGVRLSTWRPITNHPHFEDKALRQRTRELYQMYGQFSPKQVHETLLKFNTSFIILEDSQCLSASRSPDRCGLPDTVDLAYGHIPADGKRDPPHLVPSKYPRFCDEIRYGASKYTKYFKLVFHNRTFRVYEVKPPKDTFSDN